MVDANEVGAMLTNLECARPGESIKENREVLVSQFARINLCGLQFSGRYRTATGRERAKDSIGDLIVAGTPGWQVEPLSRSLLLAVL